MVVFFFVFIFLRCLTACHHNHNMYTFCYIFLSDKNLTIVTNILHSILGETEGERWLLGKSKIGGEKTFLKNTSMDLENSDLEIFWTLTYDNGNICSYLESNIAKSKTGKQCAENLQIRKRKQVPDCSCDSEKKKKENTAGVYWNHCSGEVWAVDRRGPTTRDLS